MIEPRDSDSGGFASTIGADGIRSVPGTGVRVGDTPGCVMSSPLWISIGAAFRGAGMSWGDFARAMISPDAAGCCGSCGIGGGIIGGTLV